MPYLTKSKNHNRQLKQVAIKTMSAKDEILADLQNLERQIESQAQQIQQKDLALQQKDQELEAIRRQLALLQQQLPKDEK